MNDMVANNLALVQSDPALRNALQLRATDLLPRSEGLFGIYRRVVSKLVSLKSELAAVSDLMLTVYPGSTKETEAAELLQNLPTRNISSAGAATSFRTFWE